VGDPVVRASGLRAVAVATVLGIVVGVLRFAILLAATTPSGEIDAAGLELARTSIGLTATTIGMLWIWGTIRAARGDDAVGGGLFALAATVAFAGVATDGIVTLDPLIDPDVRLADDAETILTSAGRICWVTAQLALAFALARLAWHERRGLAMFGAAVAFVVSAPMLAFDPVAMALDRSQASVAGAWWLGAVPPLLVGTGIVTAAWVLPVPNPSVWRAIGRSLELTRAALAGILVVAFAFMTALVSADASAVWLRVALTGPLALFGIAAAVGSYRASRRSIRWARWSFGGAALAIVGVVAIQVLLGALVPLGIGTIATDPIIVEQVGVGLVVLALVLLVLGCDRVDSALRRPAVVAGALLTIAAAAATAAIALRHHPMLSDVSPTAIVGVLLPLSIGAAFMVLRLLGKSVAVAEARAWGERVRAAQHKAEQARLVHERWRKARSR
jgi:hypothetical protein